MRARTRSAAEKDVTAPATGAVRTAAASRSSTAALLGGLQRSAGNRATSSLVASAARGRPTVQRVPTRDGVVEGRYDFSTRCGWIDWGHSNPTYATQLIDRVRQASAAIAAGGSHDVTSPTMESRAVGAVLSSAAVHVRLTRALSGAEILQVALGIFKRVSVDFEAQQAWTDTLGDSSFAQEDLPSNLLGFYRAAVGYSRADLERICGVVDRTASIAEFDARPTFAKNRTFTPVGATEPWPAELATIDSAAAAGLYEVTRIDLSRGLFTGSFAPAYRIEGLVGETDLFVISVGGVTLTAADDVQVEPTYQARDTTHGRYGHVRLLEVRPRRSQDATALEGHGLSTPLWLPQPVLVPLTAPGG